MFVDIMTLLPGVLPKSINRHMAAMLCNLSQQFLDANAIAVLLSGSVLRGDNLPLSDVDLYLRMSGSFRSENKELASYVLIARKIIWPSLQEIHRAGICNIQVRFFSDKHKYPKGLLAAIAGDTWLPEPMTDDELKEEARRRLDDFPHPPRYYYEYLLHTGIDWAIRLPRLVMIDVFPLLRFLLIREGYNPTTVWQWSKEEVIAKFPVALPYWRLLWDINPLLPDPNKGLQCALAGIELMEHFLKCVPRQSVL